MNERIKELRKTLDLTQQEFADRLNIKRNTVATYETGKSNPSDAAVSLICREFGVSEEWLRTGNGEMFLPPPEDDLAATAAKLLGEKDPTFEAFLETYSKLNPSNRKVLLDFGLDFFRCLQNKVEQD